MYPPSEGWNSVWTVRVWMTICFRKTEKAICWWITITSIFSSVSLELALKTSSFFSLSCDYIFNFWSYYSSTWPSLKNTLNFYFELLWLRTKFDKPSFSYWIVIGISKFIFLHGLNRHVHVNVLSERRNLKLSKQVALMPTLVKESHRE